MGAQLSRTSVGILVGVFTAFSLMTGYFVVAVSGENQGLVEFAARLPERQIPMDPRFATLAPVRSWAVAVLLAGYVAALAFVRESLRRPGAE